MRAAIFCGMKIGVVVVRRLVVIDID